MRSPQAAGADCIEVQRVTAMQTVRFGFLLSPTNEYKMQMELLLINGNASTKINGEAIHSPRYDGQNTRIQHARLLR